MFCSFLYYYSYLVPRIYLSEDRERLFLAAYFAILFRAVRTRAAVVPAAPASLGMVPHGDARVFRPRFRCTSSLNCFGHCFVIDLINYDQRSGVDTTKVPIP